MARSKQRPAQGTRQGQPKRRRRRWLIVFALLLVGAGTAGAYYVYQRGKAREGILDEARAAFRAERYEDAERLLRQVLASRPDEVEVKVLLVEALMQRGAVDEAEALCVAWQELSGHEFAARQLARILLSQGRVGQAERLLREMADAQPAYAYQMLARVRDVEGIWRRSPSARLQAADAGDTLAALARSERDRAFALVFSAEVRMEVALTFPDTPGGKARRDGMLARVELDLRRAAQAARLAKQTTERDGVAILIDRISVLSLDAESARPARERLLTRIARGGGVAQDLTMSVVLHHVRRGEWPVVVEVASGLSDAYFLQRCLWCMSAKDARPYALELTTAEAGLPEALRLWWRGSLLLDGDEAEVREGRAVLAQLLAGEHGARVKEDAIVLLADKLGPVVAAEIAGTAGLDDTESIRLRGLVASLYSAGDDVERGVRAVAGLADAVGSYEESLSAMSMLFRFDSSGIDEYLDIQSRKPGADALRHRLARSVRSLARLGGTRDAGAREQLAARLSEDLEYIARAPEATKPVLDIAAQLSTFAGRFELVGKLVGRTSLMSGEPELSAFRATQIAVAGNEEAIRALAAGLRTAPTEGRARAYLEALAACVEDRLQDVPASIERLVEASAAPDSARASLVIAGQLAYEQALRLRAAGGDEARAALARAEDLATRLLAVAPRDRFGRVLMSSVLYTAEAFPRVLEVAGAGEQRAPLDVLAFRIRALMRLERDEEALNEARALVRDHPRDPRAHLLLALLYERKGELQRALSVASLAPPDADLGRLRASLLSRQGRHDSAARIYGALASRHPSRNWTWMGLYRELTESRQGARRFLDLTGRALTHRRLRDLPATRSLIRELRGALYEGQGKLSEAREEYEAAAALSPRSWRSRNNAAGLIARAAHSRLPEAKTLIREALAIREGHFALLDTAAEVFLASGVKEGSRADLEVALGYANRAIEAVRIALAAPASQSPEAQADLGERLQKYEARRTEIRKHL